MKYDQFQPQQKLRPMFHARTDFLGQPQSAHDIGIGLPNEWLSRWSDEMRLVAQLRRRSRPSTTVLDQRAKAA